MSDLQKIKESQERFTKEWAQYREDNDRRLVELESKGFEPAEWKDRFAKMDEAQDEFERKHQELVKKYEESKERQDLLETALKRPASADGKRVLSADEIAHKAAMDGYLRRGEVKDLAELEAKVLQTSIDTQGGYAVTPETEAGILDRVRESSPMRTIANVSGIGTNEWEQMRLTGHTTGGGWVSETGTRAQTGTPTFGMVKITAGEQYEQPPVSQTMLDDANFDVEGFIGDEVAASMAIRENTAFILGDGVGKPRGVMTYAAGTDDTLFQIEQVNSGHATLVQADGLIDIQDALFEAWQANASWIMRRATRSAMRKLVDGQGNYLLQIDFSAAGAATILGKPVTLHSDVAAVGAGALAYAYGDFRAAYKIIDRIGIRVLRDPFTAKPNVLFYTTKRTGGGIVRPQAVKIGKIAA